MASMEAQMGAAGRTAEPTGGWCLSLIVANLAFGATLISGML